MTLNNSLLGIMPPHHHHHHFTITSSLSNPIPALSVSHPFLLPVFLGPSWLRVGGQLGSLVCDSRILSPHPTSSVLLCLPLSILCANILPHYSITSFPPFNFSAPSQAPAVLGWWYWLGVHFLSHPLSHSLHLLISFVPQCAVILKPLWSVCFCLSIINVSIYCKLHTEMLWSHSTSPTPSHTLSNCLMMSDVTK